MSKEIFIQHDSFSGKNFVIEKKTTGKRIDAYVYPEGSNPAKHDHLIIDGKFVKYMDRGRCK